MHVRMRRRMFSLLPVMAAGLLSFSTAGAQTTPAQITEEGLRRQEERTREQLQQLQPDSNVLQAAPSQDVSDELPDETPCFPIEEFRFTGAGSARFSWLSEELAPFQYRCIGVAGLHKLVSRLDAKLVEWGYATTKVTLPEQNLGSGTLLFRIHTGRVADVKFVQAGSDQPDESWGTWRNAFPVSAGDVLNIRNLEQGSEQMQRLPSQVVRNRIEPGTEPDTSIVVIERQAGSLRDRVRGGATLDNSGTETLGRTQFSGYLSLDNPLGLNDILSVSASSNVEQLNSQHRSQSLSFNYSIPFGYNTLSFSKSDSRFAQVVQGTTVRFLSSGDSNTEELRLSHTALRTASAKLGFYAALSTRRAKSFLDDVELIVQRRRTTNFEVGTSFRKLFGNASIDLELGYRRGMGWKRAQEDFPANEDGLTLRPSIWLASAAFGKPFVIGERNFHFQSTLRGQHTRNTTLSVDQISIGSRYNVRGFDGDSVLLAESGFYWRNEVSTQINAGANIGLQLYIGMDAGRVWGPSSRALVADSLAGGVVGIRGQWKALLWDFALAAPLYKPDGFSSRNLNPYASVTYAF